MIIDVVKVRLPERYLYLAHGIILGDGVFINDLEIDDQVLSTRIIYLICLENNSLGDNIRYRHRKSESLIEHRVVVLLDSLGFNHLMISRQKMNLDIGICLPCQNIGLLQILNN